MSARPRFTHLVSGSQARAMLKRSLAQSILSIGPSLGPLGRAVMYEISATASGTARDGFEIAKRISEESGAASVAPRMLKEAMWEVQRDLGDGTTRFACIVEAVFAQACIGVTQGIHPAPLCRAIQCLATHIPERLAALRCEVPHIRAVALSACADDEVTQLVAGLPPELIDEGVLDVKEGLQPGIELAQHLGFCFDVKPDLVGLAAEEQGIRAELDDVHLLVVNEVLDDFGSLARILEGFVVSGKTLVIVARGFGKVARSTLLVNRSRLRMQLLGLIPADMGPRAGQILDDLRLAAGARLIGQETGISLDGVRPSMLGRAKRLIIDGGRCVLVEPAGAGDEIAARRDALTAEAEHLRHVEFDREHLLRRAARLGGRWAELRIAGRTPWETEQKAAAVRVAVGAMRVAADGGVVAGGGVALWALAEGLSQSPPNDFDAFAEDIRQAALDAVCAGCRAVTRQLALNAGIEVGKLHVPSEVIDPLAVTQTILIRALSVAMTMLSIEVLVC